MQFFGPRENHINTFMLGNRQSFKHVFSKRSPFLGKTIRYKSSRQLEYEFNAVSYE